MRKMFTNIKLQSSPIMPSDSPQRIGRALKRTRTAFSRAPDEKQLLKNDKSLDIPSIETKSSETIKNSISDHLKN